MTRSKALNKASDIVPNKTRNKISAPKILIIYKSSTGFTKRYAELLAKRLGCALADFKNIRPAFLSGYDIIIFGTRAHAGSIDGLKKLRTILKAYNRRRPVPCASVRDTSGMAHPLCAIFVTGAVPAAEKDTIEHLWQNNLTEKELSRLPHFYLPAGLCYERMCFTDRMMMKGLAFMLNRKRGKTVRDIGLEKQISCSFDISSEEYLEPLISLFSQLK